MSTGSSGARWGQVTVACLAVLWVFVSMGIVAVVTPLHIVHVLDGSEGDVGAAALAFGVTTVTIRLAFSPFLHHFSHWRVIPVAAVLYSIALAGGAFVDDVAPLVVLRILAGGAEGIFYLAAASAVTAAVPESERGRALSYFSVSLFSGIAVGPILAELLYVTSDVRSIWVIAGVFGALAALTVAPLAFSLTTRNPAREAERDGPEAPARTEEHVSLKFSSGIGRLAVWCTISMALGTLGYGGFQTLLPLVGREAGLAQTGGVFGLFAIASVAVRASSAHIIDRLPSYPTAVGSTALTAGVMVLLAFSPSILGLHVAAIGLAISLGIQYPVLLKLALTGTSGRRQPPVIALYSSSFDIGMAFGAMVMGALTETFSFAVAAGVVAVVTLATVALQGVVLRPPRNSNGRG